MDQTQRAALLGTDLLLASRLRAALSAQGIGLIEATRDGLLPPMPLIFVDLNHEPEARLEAITRLRERNPSAKIVGFGNHEEKELIRRAVASGADHVVANRHLTAAALRLLNVPAAGRGAAG
jgi:DNA-binding NarL/FixJ family response regulator